MDASMRKFVYIIAVCAMFFGCSKRSQEVDFVEFHVRSLQNAIVLGNVFLGESAQMEYEQFVKTQKMTMEVLNDSRAEVNFLAAVQAVQSEDYDSAYQYIMTVMDYDPRNGYFIMLALLCAEQAGYDDAIRLYTEANTKANPKKEEERQKVSVFMDVLNGASIESCDTRGFSKSDREYLEFLAAFKNKIEKNKGQVSKGEDTITK